MKRHRKPPPPRIKTPAYRPAFARLDAALEEYEDEYYVQLHAARSRQYAIERGISARPIRPVSEVIPK